MKCDGCSFYNGWSCRKKTKCDREEDDYLPPDDSCNGRYVELGELIDLLYYVAFYHGLNPTGADGVKRIPSKGGYQEGISIRNPRAWKELGFIAADLDEYIAWRKSRLKRLINAN